MKATLVYLLVANLGIAAVNCAPWSPTPDLAQGINGVLSSFKNMIPCGDPSMGIPVLEPYRVPHIDVDVDQQLLVLKGKIDNLLLTGLGDFIVIELKTNSTNNRTSYDILFKDLQVLGEYELYINADLGGYQFAENMVGLLNIQLQDLRFTGGFTIGTNAIGGVLEYDFVTYVELGNVVALTSNYNHSVAVSNYYRNLIQDSLLLYVQEQREFINTVLSSYNADQFNALLYTVTPSENIEAMVNISNQWNAINCYA